VIRGRKNDYARWNRESYVMKSTFAPDITHYFVSMEPVHGADTLANFWREYNLGDQRAVWTVDHAIIENDEAVIEWTMVMTFLDGRRPDILRGAEWYQFKEGKIAEIRAYYHWFLDRRGRELIEFPYADRGYPLLVIRNPEGEKKMKDNPDIPSAPPATAEDIQAITEVSRDYTEDWFAADEERMRRSLHPQLVKRTIWHDLQKGTWQPSNTLSAKAMVGYTRDGGGSAVPESEKAFEIVVLDVFRDVATVKVYSYPYMDYLHLIKINDRWLILNCLYEMRVGEQTFA
jgi:hypothetical protein